MTTTAVAPTHGYAADKDALLKRRNENWSHWLHSRLAQPGTVLVAVGAGHLAGSDSVVEMLKKRGLRVRRIQ